MGKKIYFLNTAELKESFDESDNYSGLGLNAPKYSPMRHKEKLRARDFKKHKNRKRNFRNKRYDFEF